MSGARIVTRDELKEVASLIVHIESSTGLSRTLAIGRLILERFFAGSVDEWRLKSKHKLHSIRRLAELPECPLGKSALSEAVGVYVVSLQVQGLDVSRHLKASHVAAVLGLPSDEAGRLLDQAERQTWSVKRLRRETAQVQPPRRSTSKPAACAETDAGVVKRLTTELNGLLGVLSSIEQTQLEAGESVEVANNIARARVLCRMLSDSLLRLEDKLGPVPDALAQQAVYKAGLRRVTAQLLVADGAATALQLEPLPSTEAKG